MPYHRDAESSAEGTDDQQAGRFTAAGLPSEQEVPRPTRGPTVGRGGRTMTFRVWPPWAKLVPIALGICLLAGAGCLVLLKRGVDLTPSLRQPFGLTIPGLSRDRGSSRQARWHAHPASVPILMYHQLDEGGEGNRFAVTPGQFAAHVEYLRANGYTTITIEEFIAALDGAALPDKPVMLTIDDGFANQWGFVTILREYGMAATFFIPNAATISVEQLKELPAVGGVCGHTVSHPFLSQLSASEQSAEIGDNRAWLEKIVDRPENCFAYPYGDYDGDTVPALQEAGYDVAFDAWGGLAPDTGPAVDRWHVPRIEVGGNDTLEIFAAKLAGADI